MIQGQAKKKIIDVPRSTGNLHMPRDVNVVLDMILSFTFGTCHYHSHNMFLCLPLSFMAYRSSLCGATCGRTFCPPTKENCYSRELHITYFFGWPLEYLCGKVDATGSHHNYRYINSEVLWDVCETCCSKKMGISMFLCKVVHTMASSDQDQSGKAKNTGTQDHLAHQIPLQMAPAN